MPQPNWPPQYTRGRNPGASGIIDDRLPMQSPTQVHPTTNPSEAEQVLEGMTQDQPGRWRDLNQQDFY
jgi:hypothetical protein